jgi:pimeloyl-ACP methyl ester carboxylesterase
MARFMLWGVPVLLGSLAPTPVRRWLVRPLRNPLLENKLASRLLLQGMIGHAPGFPLFKPLRDDELRAVTQPVVLLIAAKSEPLDPEVLAARAEALLPRVTIELVPDAGHALTVSHLDVCAAAIARTAA